MNLKRLPYTVLMATYQTWATLNFAFCFQLLTNCLHMQMCSLTFYRTSHLTCSFAWPGWRSFVFALRGRGNVSIKYMTRLCRTLACQQDGEAHGDCRAHYKKLHDDILDNMWNQVQNWFKDHEKLSFLSLLDPQQFTSFKTTFPETAFSSLTDSYGLHFDLPRLKTELSIPCEIFRERTHLTSSSFSGVKDSVTACISYMD